jgi:hypothetical protein
MHSQHCLRVLVCFFLFFAVPSCLSAQVFTASVQGTITDATGAVVPGAQVTITNEDTNVKQTVKADGGGRYYISFLPPGSYKLMVEMKGFKTFVRSGMALQVNKQAGINVELSPGDVATRVEVTGEAPRLDSVNATLSQVFNQKTIEDLPMVSRDALNVVLLAPGIAVKPQWGNNGTNFFSSGVRNSQSDVLVDGVTATTQEQNGGVTDIKFRPKVEMIEEIKVETSNFSAEFGNTGGTVINMVTRSGTNEFHGSGFVFNNNNYMSANGFFNNKYGVNPTSGTGPFVHLGEFGGSVGGPVLIPKIYNGKNRTFFFFHHDHTYSSSRGGGFDSVPTMLARSGDFSQSTDSTGKLFAIFNPNSVHKNASGAWERDPFAGNVIPPSMFDPVAKKMISYYPEPNRPGLPYTNQNNYYAMGMNTSKSYSQTIKIDHNFSESQRIWARYSRAPSSITVFPTWGDNNPLYPRGIGGTEFNQNGALDYTRIITARTILSLRAGVVRQYARQLGLYELIPVQLNFSDFGFTGPIRPVGMPPGMTIEGYPQLGSQPTGRIKRAQDTEQLTGSLTLLRGAHSIKFGGEGRLSHLNYGQPGEDTVVFAFARRQTMQNPLAATTLQGDGLASMLLGWGSSGTYQTDGYVASAAKAYSWFINDDWRVTRRLTVNIGLRYELDIPRVERFNREASFDRFVKSPVAVPAFPDLRGGYNFATPDNRSPFLTDWNNLAPRLGIAWQALPKTVVRGGAGIFYGVSHANTRGRIANGFKAATPWVTSLDSDVTRFSSLSNPFPNGVNLPTGSSLGLMTDVGLSANAVIPQWGNKPEYYQWNFSIQREVMANSVIEIAYAGTRGVHLPNGALRNIDRIGYYDPSAWSLGTKLTEQVPNPFYGVITNPTSTLSQPTVQRIQLLRPYPQFTSIAAKPGPENADSIYHALQLKFTKRYSYGLNLAAHYTFSKTIDDDSQNGSDTQWLGGSTEAQTPFNMALERSLSTWDQRHRFVLDFTWEVPFGRKKLLGSNLNRWLDGVLGQWQVNGILTYQSAFPLVAVLASGNLPDATQRPNLLTDPRIPGSAVEKYDRYFNTAAFSQPAPYTFGTAPRVLSTLRGPFQKNLDASLFKKFALTGDGRVYLQVVFSAYNATNRVTFNDPNMTFGSGSFGQITSTAMGARYCTLAAKLYF